MIRPGPDLETLTRRLADTPPDFLDEPRLAGSGRVRVPALINDLAGMHGGCATLEVLETFTGQSARSDRNRLAVALIGAWLLADPWFLAQRLDPRALVQLLAEVAAEMAAATPAHRFVADAERREELVRTMLDRFGYRPAGETAAQAADRLAAISAVERRRLLEASRAAEQRAREIREALARKVADESADKWTRE
ncbi:MAG: hypothetical protein ACXWC4_03625 [Telluria sp.]